jgi:SAM-dependent methyltransferase
MAQAYGSTFAQFYNRQATAFAEEAAPLIYEFYLTQQQSTSAHGKNLLDLCCGTGQLARFFLQRGFTVTGIDLSEPMLALARQNAGDYVAQGSATFLQADASNFTMADSFNLVVSTYDALNHLPDLAALRRCFASVAAVTANDGCFIFDLNTRQGIRRWNGIMINESEDGLVINRGIYDGGERAQMLITGFISRGEPGLFERFEECVYNTVYTLSDVETLLVETGWRKVHFARLSNLGEAVATPEHESRIFIVAAR